jgi:NADPH:quinone reductase-like Zn-dependent oxidoreductase
MISTDAWVLHAAEPGALGKSSVPTGSELSRENFSFSEPGEDETLVEPLYGSWEANIEHALLRQPIDICSRRGEDTIVLGNLGIVRVLRAGATAVGIKEGSLCMVMPFAKCDNHGYAELVYAYDAPRTIGVMAKRTKVRTDMLLPIPEDTVYSLPQWATYARFFTAWDNWQVAFQCWKAQMRNEDPSEYLVFGWGGGVVFAELLLARRAGFRTAMTAARDWRLSSLAEHDIAPVDRRAFPDIEFDAGTASSGKHVPDSYRVSEKKFLQGINDLSGGRGAAIFLDNIGAPLYKATLKAMARQGVLATVGWKHGMHTLNYRASECIKRHIHVHTHVWRFQDSAAIRDYQEKTAWIADIGPNAMYGFDDVNKLASDYSAGRIDSYFPIFQVNEV